MKRNVIRSLIAVATLGSALALTQVPASAQETGSAPAPMQAPASALEAGWAPVQDLGSAYFCQAAGIAGQTFGRWQPGDWRCVGPVLWVRNDPLLAGGAPA
ncbi:hypothetical protein [Amycolatopsis tucumanensis]|uniref:Chitin-binding type-3 domain-containing protein n=1 Tax=Amycolatopsis tucumanensis TaxID=401106 RepID=A0ABP7J361_9PSEU|nr:hypothetical protein [Amycolatopsis tucumanensis]MCF6425305.1 hypothetical protein [Amycolatopsis tucumanensis]